MSIAEPQKFDANGLPLNEAPKKSYEQARHEWLEARKGAIGASDVAAILGISPFTTAYEVWLDKTDRLHEWKGNRSTRAGNTFEAVVLNKAEDELGPLDRNVRLVHPDLPIASTLDGQVQLDKSPVEAKVTGIEGPVFGKWGDALSEDFPDYYLVQVHTQLIVTGAELGYLFALIAGRGVVKYQVEPRPSLHKIITDKVCDWWERHIVRGIEPKRSQPVALEVVKRLKREPKKKTTLDMGHLKLMQKRTELKAQEKQVETELKAIDSEILLAMGDAEEASLPDGSRLTYFERHRKGFTTAPCTYRQMQFIPAKG